MSLKSVVDGDSEVSCSQAGGVMLYATLFYCYQLVSLLKYKSPQREMDARLL